MELEIIENSFVAENIENFLTAEKFEDFKKNLSELASIEFDKNEKGRKEAKSLSRKVGTLKSKITEKFDELIKSEKAKNDEFVKYLKELTSTKAKYLKECESLQDVLKISVVAFENKVDAQLNVMKSTLKQYQSLAELNDAKQAVVTSFESFQWEEKEKDAGKLLGEILDKLIMQEAMIAKLEAERQARKEAEAKAAQERLEREHENTKRLIVEQAERVAQGKEIELPPIPTPAPIAAPTPQQQSYAIQKPAEPDKPKDKYTLFYDTETTSKIATQARIVQIGALVLDDDGNELERLDVLVKQDAPIPPETIEIHGKTDAMCAEKGIPLAEALTRFKNLYDNVDFIVGHNSIAYDNTVIESEFKRIGINFKFKKINEKGVEVFEKPNFDTMPLYKDIVKCPPTEKQLAAGFTAYKVPKLDEAYEFVFGKGFDNAHDALSDVIATADLFNHYKAINKKVIAIMTSGGISQDQARLVAKMLSREDLTLYTQYDTFAVLKQVKKQQADIASVVSENKKLKAENAELLQQVQALKAEIKEQQAETEFKK